MSIKEAPMYFAECDGCGMSAEEGGDYSGYGRKIDANDSADDRDWRVKDDRHYCVDCLDEASWCFECDEDYTSDRVRDKDDIHSCQQCAGTYQEDSA